MNSISTQFIKIRSEFLKYTRAFFYTRDFLEVDTPCLKNFPGSEPYLDPFQVVSVYSQDEGYLITSPEYSLKQILAGGFEKIFEIAHVFRSGESGKIHSREFLMLEFYVTGMDEFGLMQFCEDLFRNLFGHLGKGIFPTVEKISMYDFFIKVTGLGFSREELRETLHKNGIQKSEDTKEMRYEDLFFLVFLNLLEPKLQDGFTFLYHYPKELAALSRIEGGICRRFEVYWGNTELGNAFYEVQSAEENRQRLLADSGVRQSIGKKKLPLDEEFLDGILPGLGDVSGMSIGLDRLFMKLLNLDSLKGISPYWEPRPLQRLV